MIRTTGKRAGALLWAIFFLLSTAGEGFGLQPCPYHDSLHDHLGSVEAGDEESHHHHGSGEQQQSAAPDGHPPGHHSENEVCTHLDACQATAGAVLHVDLEAGAVGTETLSVAPTLVPVERIAAPYPPYFLPYSNAPPAVG